MTKWPSECPFCGSTRIAVMGGEFYVGAKCVDCNVVIQGSVKAWEEKDEK